MFAQLFIPKSPLLSLLVLQNSIPTNQFPHNSPRSRPQKLLRRGLYPIFYPADIFAYFRCFIPAYQQIIERLSQNFFLKAYQYMHSVSFILNNNCHQTQFMELNPEKFEKIGCSSRILEFSQPGLQLVGSTIKANKIQGPLGTAEIISTRYDPIGMVKNCTIYYTHQEISRVFIIKSNKFKKDVPIGDEDKNIEEQNVELQKREDSEYGQDESPEQKQERKDKKIRKKRKVDLKKDIRSKLQQLDKKN